MDAASQLHPTILQCHYLSTIASAHHFFAVLAVASGDTRLQVHYGTTMRTLVTMAPTVFLSLKTVLTLFFFQEAHPSGNLGNLDDPGQLNKHKHTPHDISLRLALTHRLRSHIAWRMDSMEWTGWVF